MLALPEGLDPWGTYLAFVAERHAIYEARQYGLPQPWTNDPILSRKKFTNVYRLLDPGSQYVIETLIDPELDPRDQLLRLFLYRHTGKVEAWEFLDLMVGLPSHENLQEVLGLWKGYRGRPRMVPRHGKPDRAWADYARTVFTGAYLVFSQSQEPGTDKLVEIIRLTERLFTPGSPDDVVPDFLAARTQAERFAVLRSRRGVGDFMAMQILTDWGYGTEFREDEFVICGPGARRGAAVLDPRAKPEATARRAHRQIARLAQLGNRCPSLMDAQNTLCEFSKYVRYLGNPPTGAPYRATHPGPQPEPTLPAHWR